MLGESYLDCCERLIPFLQRFEEECRCGSESTLLVVAHQAILRCIFGYLLDRDPSEIPHIKIPQHTIMQLKWSAPDDQDDLVVVDQEECVIEYVRMPIDHADQGVVAAALQE